MTGIANSASVAGAYTVTVINSRVIATVPSGTNNVTISNNASFTTRVAASQLAGAAVTGGGTITCAGVYDEAFVFSASTCP